MSSISLDDTPFTGVSRSFSYQGGPRRPVECSSCGSSLHGRLERRRWGVIDGTRYVVDVFRCRCGTGRHIRRPAKSAAAG